MATLQKIRSKGKILIAVVGLALFAFIAEEFVRSLSYTQSESRQRIGKIYSEKINVQDFNAQVDEYANVIKFTNGLSSLSDEQMSMIRDQVWQTTVNEKLIEHETDKLGLTVTDEELQEIISKGQSPMLSQTPFRTQAGGFDYNALKQFLSQYDEIMTNNEVPVETKEQYNQMFGYWKFVEKSIRKQALIEKYQNLLTNAIMSNPVAAKQNYEGRINESDILMAAIPYSTIKDSEITIEDSELKAKYNELKETFLNIQETRNFKYIDIAVKASKEDIEALDNEMNGYAQALAEGADPAKTIREAASLVSYSSMPISKHALPHDMAEALDSMSEGSQVGPYYHEHDNSVNIVRLISKVSRPDSIEVRQIGVPGATIEEMRKTADSIMVALNGGADFDTIAKKYDQPAAKNWITSAQYEGQTLDENNRMFLETLNTAAVGAYNKIELDNQGILIAQVTDRRNIIDKYNVAAIKRTRDFSKDTYGKAYNDISAFLAGNPTQEEIEANAQQAGYTVQSRENISSSEHYVANVSSTRETMRWLFNDKTKVGDVSPLYECGENDHLLVVILTGINPKGYGTWNQEDVKSRLTSEVMKDKKAALLLEKIKDAKSISDITKIEGAVSDTVKHINFTSPAFISKVGSSEPILAGAVSSAKQGDFKTGIKGNSSVFAFQVLSQNKLSTQYDEEKEKKQSIQTATRFLGSFTSELYKKADITDNRYIFY